MLLTVFNKLRAKITIVLSTGGHCGPLWELLESYLEWIKERMGFFLIQFWKIVCLQEFIHFIQVVQFVGIQLFIIFSYNPLYFFGVNCYFSSFISDFIYLGPFSFFFLMSLVKILSILFIFSKNQFLESLTFSIVFCTLFCLFLL